MAAGPRKVRLKVVFPTCRGPPTKTIFSWRSSSTAGMIDRTMVMKHRVKTVKNGPEACVSIFTCMQFYSCVISRQQSGTRA